MTYFTIVGGWFTEDNFTYVRVFESLAAPYILLIYVHDNLLAKENSYETVGHGVTKVLKDSKKAIWPQFHNKCGVYALDISNHVVL